MALGENRRLGRLSRGGIPAGGILPAFSLHGIIATMPNIRNLSPLTVAQVRSGVVCALVCAATDLDTTLRESLPSGRFALRITGSPGVNRRLVFENGHAEEQTRGFVSANLRFIGPVAMATALGGGSGTVVPLPASPKFLKAVKAFLAASRRVGELSAQREFSDDAEKLTVTEMLMTAALRGVVETARADPWTAPKSAKMPDGIVELTVGDSELKGWVRREGEIWESGRGRAPGKVNARLSFADIDTAFGLFTGSVVALNALGRGTVSIRGKVPMIQTLFPLLDRFSEIMQWKADSPEARI